MDQEVLYSGTVQGVGFRYTVRRLAESFTVTGTVRNLRDGRVELHVRGTPEETARFLQAIRESRLGELITAEARNPLPPDALTDLHGFEIRP